MVPLVQLGDVKQGVCEEGRGAELQHCQEGWEKQPHLNTGETHTLEREQC